MLCRGDRSALDPLFEYRPTMLHSKVSLVDEDWASAHFEASAGPR